MAMTNEYLNRLAERVYEYRDPWDDESSLEATKEAITESPECVIEYLLDLLDTYTMEV